MSSNMRHITREKHESVRPMKQFQSITYIDAHAGLFGGTTIFTLARTSLQVTTALCHLLDAFEARDVRSQALDHVQIRVVVTLGTCL